MCGIIGLFYSNTNEHVRQALVDALTVLQHRGQDAAGIVTIKNNRFNLRKHNGTVAEVFTQDSMISMLGSVGIGHVRYPTAGGACSAEAQPLYTNTPFGIALAHNGNLTNTLELLRVLENEHRHINTNSDSEVLLNVFAEELQRRHLQDISPDEIFDTVRSLMRKCRGGYSVIMLINGVGMLAFRDPNGIRPLCYGIRETEHGIDYAIASESVALDTLDPQFVLERDVGPGEAILISPTGQFFSHSMFPDAKLTPCLFEYVYFARPDSILDGVVVYEARAKMGEKLAKKILNLFPDHDIDVVVPIPETSRTSALQCATILNIPYREGFIKNRYIARTFIMPGQQMRRKTVRLKLNAIKSEFKDKCVLLFDDSIVRGTTSRELIQMARDAGARKIYFASAAPPVRFANVYGIDIPTRSELVAHNRTEDEIARELGADKILYNDLEDVEEAVREINSSGRIEGFDSSCFNGKYVTGVSDQYILALEMGRGRGRNFSAATDSEPPVPSSPGRSPGVADSSSPISAHKDPVPFAWRATDGPSMEVKVVDPTSNVESNNMQLPAGMCEALHNFSSSDLPSLVGLKLHVSGGHISGDNDDGEEI